MQGQGHHNKLLLFQVGPVKCSLFSNDILTIIPPPKQETAGRTGRLPGIFRHNNRIVRVVDMRTKFGLSPSSPEHGRLILAEIPKGLVAFWVDHIINVIDQEEGRWDILPATLPRDVFTRTFVLDEELILHTECARMEAMSPSAALTEHIEQLQEQEKARRAKRAAPTATSRPVAPEAKPTAAPKTETATTAPMTATPHTAPTEPIKTEAPKAIAEKVPLTPPPREERPQAAKPSPSISPAHPGITPRPETTSTATGALGQGPHTAARPTPRPETKPAATIQARPSIPRPSTTPSRSTEPSTPYTPPRPSPAAVTPPPPTQAREWEEEEQGSGLGWLMLFLLFIFLGGSGAMLYFTGFFERQPGTTPPVASVEEPLWQPPDLGAPVPEPPLAEPEEAPLAEAEPVPSLPQAPPAEAEPVPAQPEEAPAEAAPSEPQQPASAQPPEEAPYSASIEKDEQGITITLEGPLEQPQESLLKEGEVPTTEAQAEPAEPASEAPGPEATPTETSEVADTQPEAPPEPVKPKPAPKPQKRVITHVVVKGDTLWDIAERYVKDPYRYPELARLSGIKNPDLIYPGDIVRIVEK